MAKQSDSSGAPGGALRRTVPYILQAKEAGEKLVALTAYDFWLASLLDRTGAVDIILVGDSAATVVQGFKNTLPITLEEMIYHSRCVSRGVQSALVVADLPFLSYQVSPEQAILSAGKLLKEGGAQAVKLEGGRSVQESIARLVAVDIPVLGHVGLTPQSYHRMGGHKIQGKRVAVASQSSADDILQDALAVQEAGAFGVVLEGVPAELASEITSILSIPTIGIGAGAACDGQILVTHDLLGLLPDFQPKFVKRYRALGEEISDAIKEYAEDVRSSAFPTEAHSVSDKPPVRLMKR
ncbi:MAG: 3-methyl-2-oxobutanoate hydroxymethyltransferase [Bdellovibrionales bacterium]|nr:3-methyl-2-oxobutanoate hydroxymethyltransferase [Bdellovibrionales bacterium]